MKESKNRKAAAVKPAEVEAKPVKAAKPLKITLKKGNVLKIALIIVAIIIAIPVIDALIQFSIIGRYAAFVGGSQITRSDYTKELEKQYSASVIQGLIVQQLITNEASAQKINIGNDKVEEQVANLKKQFSTEAEFNSALTSENLSLEDLKKNIKLQLALTEIVKPSITPIKDTDAKAYYDQNKDTQFKDKKFEDVKATIVTTLESSQASQKKNDWISAKIAAFNKENDLTVDANKQYKLFNSFGLIARLFGRN